MSDKTIKRGDLVMIVRPKPCCGYSGTLGQSFEVLALKNDDGRCFHCGLEYSVYCAQRSENDWVPVSRLIKINPPAKDTETEREKEAV